MESVPAGDLSSLNARCDHSWMRDLTADPETERHAPNKTSRQVKSGHYVRVLPSPLPDPQLVAFSPAMAAELGLSAEACGTAEFARLFSGDLSVADRFESWATPYALSIFGEEMYDNCPFKNGNGYGDGRAMSIGEALMPNGRRWEMQLKGGGATPFCRGADGRAVLRSSVREFLASEAMHHMGVETTRALSLVTSKAEMANRPWYSGSKAIPDIDEKFMQEQFGAKYESIPPEMREMAKEQVRSQLRNPDKMQREPCAITCRVAPSFTRIGHLDLHGRRARRGGPPERQALELMVQHALAREFADVDDPSANMQIRTLGLLRGSSARLSKLMADWLRVGYVQGNFNSDNCLIAGRTMDYGPFGFVERYDPLFNMWTGGGDKFAFINQPGAAHKNFATLVRACAPLLNQQGVEEAQQLVTDFPKACSETVNDMWRQKLGLQAWDADVEELHGALLKLMASSPTDYTLLWRQLAEIPARGLSGSEALAALRPAFYAEQMAPQAESAWASWLERWIARLAREGVKGEDVAAAMRRVSPKYIPREWMLVEAYRAAERGDHSGVQTLYELFAKPFDEHPELAGRYYRQAPQGSHNQAGVGFMS